MNLRIAQPQYGGTFTTNPEAAPLRFVLPNELVDPNPFTILEPSPNRTAPACQHFGACGGCDYQHADYPTQLALKRTILTNILNLPEIEVHSAEPWQYRNRIRLRIEPREGSFRFGYNRRATRDFLPIVECPIAAPLLLRAAEALLQAAAINSLAAAWLASTAEVEFQTNGNAVQMTLFTRNRRTQDFGIFCGAVREHLPELAGAGCLAATAGYGAKERAAWGGEGMVHYVGSRGYWVTRGAFFQVNATLLPVMLDLVTGNRTGSLAWDLYAGVGLFSRALTESFLRGVAVESASVAASNLKALANSNKNKGTVAVEETTADFLRTAILQRERPDLIVMDPPRAGLGEEVCSLLARIAAPDMVYVSCDPTTLARDLAMLVHSGYRIEKVHLLDMFPQTFHLETVVFLQK